MGLQKILYVDDDQNLHQLVGLALQQMGGLTVQICESGIKALELAAIFKPDLILLDVVMPGMDGLETCRELRKIPATRQTPVVFFTGHTSPNDLLRYRTYKPLGVVSKPFVPLELPLELLKLWKEHHCSGVINSGLDEAMIPA